MKRSRIIIILFILINFLSILVVNKFIQSDIFGKYVSSYVINTYLNKAKIKFNFKNVKIKSFPFVVEINSPEVNFDNIYFNCLKSKLSFRIGFKYFKTVIPKFNFENCSLLVEKKNNSKNKIQFREIIDKLYKNAPGDISFRDIAVNYNKELIFSVNKLNYFYKSKQILDVELTKIRSTNSEIVAGYVPDYIYFKLLKERDILLFKNIKIFKEFSTAIGEAEFNLINSTLNAKLNVNTTPDFISSFFDNDIKKVINFFHGNVSSTLSLSTDFKKIKFNAKTKVHNFSFNGFVSDYALFDIGNNSNVLKITNASVYKNKGILTIENDLNLKTVANDTIKIKSTNYDLGSLVFSKDGYNKNYNGNVNGLFDLKITGNNVSVNNSSNVKVDSFEFKDNKNNILGPVDLNTDDFRLVVLNGKLTIKSKLKLLNKLFLLNVNNVNNNVLVKINLKNVNFDSLNYIVGKKFKGEGDVIFQLYKEKITLDYMIKKFHGFKIQFKKLKGKVFFDLKTGIVKIVKNIGSHKKSEIYFNGLFNIKNSLLNLKLNTNRSSCYDMKDFLEELLPKSKDYLVPKNLDCILSSDGSFYLSDDKFDLNLSILGTPRLFKYLSFQNFSTKLKITDKFVDIMKFKLQTNSNSLNTISGKYWFSGDMDAKLKLNKFKLKSLPLFKSFKANPELNGEYRITKVNNIIKQVGSVTMSRFFVQNTLFPKSYFALWGSEKSVNISTKIFNSWVNLDFLYDFRKQFRSRLKGSVNLDFSKIGYLLGINDSKTRLKGSVQTSLDLDFFANKIKNINGNISIKNFNFISKNETLSLNNTEIIKIKNSVLSKSVSLLGSAGQINSRFKGNLDKKFSIITKSRINLKLFNFLHKIVEFKDGLLIGNLALNGDKELSLFGDVSFDNAEGEFVPFRKSFKVIKSKVIIDNLDLLINNIDAFVGVGKLSTKGKIKFNFPFPETDIKLNLKNYRHSISTKSYVDFDNFISVKGKAPPYLIKGGITVTNGIISDQLSALNKILKLKDKYSQYLPVVVDDLKHLFRTDIMLQSKQYLKLSNDLANISFKIQGRVTGFLDQLKPNLKISIKPQESKIKFKISHFEITQGNVSIFNDDKYLDIFSEAIIQNYNLKLRVFGDLSNVKLNLSSSPPLSQNDIFSLVTFGYTQSMTDNLTDGAKNSLATMGVGSFIFEQLRLTKGLSNGLGIRFNLSTDIKQEDETINSKVGSVTSENRSLTKFQIKKSLNEKTELMFSNTVGAENDQTQETNINYNINKNVSIDGVYETKSNNADTLNKSSSFGVDLIYKWDF